MLFPVSFYISSFKTVFAHMFIKEPEYKIILDIEELRLTICMAMFSLVVVTYLQQTQHN